MTKSPYQKIGEEQGVDQLVERFYHYMETLPEAKNCLLSHPDGVITTRLKLKEFLSGWFGGPNTYIEKYGHPRMKMRHLPFKIGEVERNEWLLCIDLALNDLNLKPKFKQELMKSFTSFAVHMQNR